MKLKSEDIITNKLTDFPESELPTVEQDIENIKQMITDRGLDQWVFIGMSSKEIAAEGSDVPMAVKLRINVGSDKTCSAFMFTLFEMSKQIAEGNATVKKLERDRKENPQ